MARNQGYLVRGALKLERGPKRNSGILIPASAVKWGRCECGSSMGRYDKKSNGFICEECTDAKKVS